MQDASKILDIRLYVRVPGLVRRGKPVTVEYRADPVLDVCYMLPIWR